MAVVIRMRRTGRRNRPCYRINVADSRSPRDGSFLETLGLYDPINADAEAQIKLDVERARHWLQSGALPSETVASIFRRQGVYEGLAVSKERKRRGRKTSTKTHARRVADKADRAQRKEARRKERVAAKQAAASAEGAEA